MTAKELKQYQQLELEIKDLKEDISDLKSRKSVDVVKASHKEFPYTEHTISVYGNDETSIREIQGLIDEKRQKISELEQLRAKIEQFINSIEDSQMRRIIRLKYIRGYSWGEVANRIRGNNTRDSVRMMCKRFLKNFSKK